MTEWVPRGQTVNRHYCLRVLTIRSENEQEENGPSYGKTIRGSCIETTRRLIMLYL